MERSPRAPCRLRNEVLASEIPLFHGDRDELDSLYDVSMSHTGPALMNRPHSRPFIVGFCRFLLAAQSTKHDIEIADNLHCFALLHQKVQTGIILVREQHGVFTVSAQL